MKTRLLTASAAALILCAPAFAQTATTTDTANSSASMSSAMPQGWNAEIGNAFFTDADLGTLRTEDEISTNWASLSAEQQAQVASYCDTIDTASATGVDGSTMPSGDAAAGVTAGGTASPSIEGQSTTGVTGDTTAGATTGTMGTDATGGVSSDTTASTTPDAATGATGAMDAGASVNVASMQRLCDVVGDFD